MQPTLESQTKLLGKKRSIFILALIIFTISNCVWAQQFTYMRNGKIVRESEIGYSKIIEDGKVISDSVIDLTKEMHVIIKFKQAPISLAKKGKALNKSVTISSVVSEHESFKTMLQNSVSSSKSVMIKSLSGSYKIEKEFFKAINGVSMSCQLGLVSAIRELPMVQEVYEDMEVHAYTESNISQINADRVQQELGYSGKGIVVGIIDTGIDYTNPALGGGFGPDYRVIGGYDFANNDPDPMDDHFHGTHVAGIIGANSNSLKGVAPDVKFRAVKVLDAKGSGATSSILAGIEYCMDPDNNPETDDAVDIINMSLGGKPFPGNPLDDAVNNASAEGILCCVAAGNSGGFSPTLPSYESLGSPGTAEKALTVGACDSLYKMAYFSSKGPDPIHNFIKPEIVAPGVKINSTVLSGQTQRYSGTSMATPHIAGTASLLKEQHPDWTPEQLKWALVNSTQPLKEQKFNPYIQGNGLVDSWAASQLKTIVTPGILNYRHVANLTDDWKDTLTILVQNNNSINKTYAFTPTGDYPVGINLQFQPSSLTVSAESQKEVTVILNVSPSVPIIETEPYAYYGKVLCISDLDTLTIPFGFVKANTLQMNFDQQPVFILLWNPATQWSNVVSSVMGQQTYNVKIGKGAFNLFASIANSGYGMPNYSIEKHIQTNGFSQIYVSHDEAKYNLFPEPIYDASDNLRTYNSALMAHVAYELIVGKVSYQFSIVAKDMYASALDSSFLITRSLYLGPQNNLVLLWMNQNGIKDQDDLFIRSGSKYLANLNVKYDFAHFNTFGKEAGFGVGLQRIGTTNEEALTFDNLTRSTIAIQKNSDSFDSTFFSYFSLVCNGRDKDGLPTEVYKGGNYRLDENNNLILFQNAPYIFQSNNPVLIRNVLSAKDTIIIAPNSEIQLPEIAYFYSANLPQWYYDWNRVNASTGIITPSGIGSSVSGRGWFPLYGMTLKNYDNGILSKVLDTHISLNDYPVSFAAKTLPYYLLGQIGHTTVNYNVDARYKEENKTSYILSPPKIDQLMVLADGKYAKWLKPEQEGKIRLVLFDLSDDIKNVNIFLISSSGEDIKLTMHTVQERHEYLADIPNSLPHEFIDIKVVAGDQKGGQTILIASPGFFFGNSLEERKYDSRVFLDEYSLKNVKDIPFSVGDTLRFDLRFCNTGNITAENVQINFPKSDVFKPLGSISWYQENIGLNDTISIPLTLKLMRKVSQDSLFAYSPEISWTSNEKSFLRKYPMFVRISNDVATGIVSNSVLPQTYVLHQNYPNPFNPSTHISYEIPMQSRVVLKIYDILGREVQTLINEEQTAGNYKITWTPRNLSNGIYFYRLAAGNFTETKKMILLK